MHFFNRELKNFGREEKEPGKTSYDYIKYYIGTYTDAQWNPGIKMNLFLGSNLNKKLTVCMYHTEIL
jgi:hypothetical protein